MPAPPVALSRVPRHPGALDRPRLLDALELDAPVVVLVAPAGWGKTVLAAQLARARGDGVVTAWCRAAPGWDLDTDVVAVWSASLDRPLPDADPVSALLELAEAGPTTFVLDDAHLADGEALDRLLAEAAPLLPADARVIVAGRGRPAGLLGRLGPLAVALDDELAFDAEEAAALAQALGGDPDAARRRVDQLGGWPAGVAAAATAGDGEVGAVLLGAVGPDERAVLVALAALPWVDEPLARALGWAGPAGALPVPGALAGEASGRWTLDRSVGRAVLDQLEADEVTAVRLAAAEHLRQVDPTAAIEVLLEVGRPEAAAEVLAEHLSTVGEDHAVAWLYRLPAELRHRFPPVLASGRATVALDLAEADAERRLDEAAAAGDEDARREALLALGSARAAGGRLSAAAEALESALAGGVDDPVARRARPMLALVRAWSGDEVGALAALADPEHDTDTDDTGSEAHTGDDERTAAARAQVLLLAGDLDGAADAARAAGPLGVGLAAQAALLGGERDRARVLAADAYRDAVDVGGDRLTQAAVARAWVLVLDGDLEGALGASDVLERRVGRHDALARLHGALVRLAVARVGGPGDPAREARRVAVLREAGFAPVEALVRRALPGLGAGTASGPALLVELLGEGRVLVDGRPLGEGAWRSRKALEVLRVLALGGSAGTSREALIEAVWPGRDPDSARTVLRRALSDVRKELEPDRPTGEASRFVATSGERVTLAAASDLDEAERVLATDPDRSFTLLEAGPAADLGDGEWAEELRRRVGRLRLQAAEVVAGRDGDPDRRRVALERLVADEPWSRDHVDALAALHRDRGDEAAARAVERAWFDDEG